MKDLSNYRKNYEKNELLEENISQNPLQLFKDWFAEVEAFGGVEEVNAMSISTVGIDGFPKTRVVLLKEIQNEGYVFYTNYNSEKGKALLHNPNVCLSFFWPNLERQIIIKGVAEKVADEVSDRYFSSRPAGSQLGAIASEQSEVVESRLFLEQKLTDLEAEYLNKKIDRPKSWGGFLIKPLEYEFWQGRPNRLHDRIRFSNNDHDKWQIERLSP
jgi:pyridoxamine 5'-phosphate oxidase